MGTNTGRCLVIVKQTAFSKGGRAARLARAGDSTASRIVGAHRQHIETVEAVRGALKARRIDYLEASIGTLTPALKRGLARADLVITVGGDGTALGASHYIRDGRMVSVNSAPGDSVGHYCSLSAGDFAGGLDDILSGRWKPFELARIEVRLDGRPLPELALNDLLIAHQSPASTTRYLLRLGAIEEEHRSSGIWISTASGSTAAIHSAGGSVMPLGSRKLQYLVRELYCVSGTRYRLAKGMTPAGGGLTIASKMPEGRLYIDGSKTCYNFHFGVRADISISDHPLRMYLSKGQRRR